MMNSTVVSPSGRYAMRRRRPVETVLSMGDYLKSAPDHRLLQEALGAAVPPGIPSLRDVMKMGVEDRSKLLGIGIEDSERLSAIFEIGKRMSSASLDRNIPLSRSRDVYDFAAPLVKDDQTEGFYLITLDPRSRPIECHRVSSGTVNGTLVSAREIMKVALKDNAVGMITFHNHPSGSPEPSDDDRAVVRLLSYAADTIGIRYVDNLIFAKEGFVSMRGEVGAYGDEASKNRLADSADPEDSLLEEESPDSSPNL